MVKIFLPNSFTSGVGLVVFRVITLSVAPGFASRVIQEVALLFFLPQMRALGT